MTEGKPMTAKDIASKLTELTQIMSKNQQVLSKNSSLGKHVGVQNDFDPSDFATNEDLVDLVGELQTQLDSLEERNIRRIFNSRLSEDDKTKIIAPVLNRYGEEPPESLPRTAFDFQNINKADLLQLCYFYELGAVELSREDETLEEADSIDGPQMSQEKNEQLDFSEALHKLNPETMDSLFNDVARYLGLSNRKGNDRW